MSFTHTYTVALRTADRGHTASKTVTADGSDAREIAVAADDVDLRVDIGIDAGLLIGLYILADQDLTLETNDSAAPDNTIDLQADVPYIYHANAYTDNPFTADVTRIYVTAVALEATTLYLEVLQDSTSGSP